jgi:iron complex outermembrane receptor protein
MKTPVWTRLVVAAWLSVLSPSGAFGQALTRDLTSASLEDLMNIEVTTVSKREEKLSKTAAAIFVITQEDIRRSGATNIPDLLRMVPGMEVAQVDANSWAISCRGFNDLFANKLLVMIDGRSVYDETFAGVSWDLQDVPVEDIDRIEVIRGPGATVWGANAVNGVINIITKSSKATQGGMLVGGGGTRPGARGLLQYGGKLGGNGHYRIFGDYFNDPSEAPGLGISAADAWRMSHGGFRADWDWTGGDSLTVEGDISTNNEGETITSFVSFLPPFTETFNSPIHATSGSLLARWDHKFSDRSDTMVQVYYDGLQREWMGAHEDKDTLDLEFQHHVEVGSRHDFVWGIGYREDSYDGRPSYALTMIPSGRTDQLFNSFAQDEIRLSNTFWLTVGSKLEHNSYTGFEYEPSGRFLWSPSDRQALWGSVSRAIRQPSREDVDLQFNADAFLGPENLPMVATVLGNPNFKSEKLLAYELGYRVVPSPRVSLDFATFYNIYHDLRTVDALNPYFDAGPVPHEVIPEMFSNAMHGNTYGAEISSTLNVFRWWRVTPAYSWLQMNLHPEAGSYALAGYQLAGGDSPRNQYQIRSSFNLRHHLELDPGAYYVDHLPDQFVPSHTRLDLRLGWYPTESTEFSIVGQNLQQPRHFEFGSQSELRATQIKRSVYGEIRWWF